MDSLTAVTALEVRYLKDRVNYRLLFPTPALHQRIDRGRSIAYFPPNAIVGYGRWRANEYGTQIWRCFVLRILAPDSPAVRIPGVSPGAEVLLSTRGAIRSKRFLAFVDSLKKDGHAPENFSASYWRQVHLALQVNQELHTHGNQQRTAASMKREVVR